MILWVKILCPNKNIFWIWNRKEEWKNTIRMAMKKCQQLQLPQVLQITGEYSNFKCDADNYDKCYDMMSLIFRLFFIYLIIQAKEKKVVLKVCMSLISLIVKYRTKIRLLNLSFGEYFKLWCLLVCSSKKLVYD